jgi:sRNA-binding carbon storage regulator CsrA
MKSSMYGVAITEVKVVDFDVNRVKIDIEAPMETVRTAP